jgi:hypothetical protein
MTGDVGNRGKMLNKRGEIGDKDSSFSRFMHHVQVSKVRREGMTGKQMTGGMAGHPAQVTV